MLRVVYVHGNGAEHINRINDNWLAKIAKYGKPNIVRPSGRPSKR